MRKRLLIAGVVLLVIAAGFVGYNQLRGNKPPESDRTREGQSANGPAKKIGFDKSLHPIDQPGSPWWIVNKQRPLPDGYKPAELIAPDIRLRWARDAETMQVSKDIAGPLEDMDRASREAGHALELISGFRSAEYQQTLYDSHVKQYGEAEADRQSARAGTSEHQTGLTIDLGRPDKKCDLLECFGETPEGKWLAGHAHEYGFIVRYLEGKEEHTGYMYEPWHLRYVGKELATELHAKNLTMEEFFNL